MAPPGVIRLLLCAVALNACAAAPLDSAASEERVFMITAAPLPPPYPDGLPILEETPLPITAICADGWYSYSTRRRETCGGHGGVREWVNRPPA